MMDGEQNKTVGVHLGHAIAYGKNLAGCTGTSCAPTRQPSIFNAHSERVGTYMTDRVVNFADMAFKLRGKKSPFEKDDRCEHIHVTLNDEGGIVECSDCGKQLDAYITLRRMCEKWERHAQEVKSAVQRVNEDAKAIVILRAAKRIEEAWRSRTMIPTCPHCNVAILPEDGFGGSRVNREMELRRRKVKREQLGKDGRHE